jgi:HlyD family secretion protein
MLKAIVSAVVLGIIALVVVAAVRGSHTPVVVSTTRATPQNLTSWIASNGKVEPIQPYVIQARLMTFIEGVKVKEGQFVRAGQILMTLDTKDLQSQLTHLKEQLVAAEDERRIAAAGGSPDEIAQLQTDLSKTDTEIARLRRESDSLDRLYAKQAATRQEVEQNKLALDKALADKRLIEQKRKGIADRAQVQAERAALRASEAQSSIRTLEEQLTSARVTAPVQGTIYSLVARPGALVHEGDVLAEIADLTRLQVRVFVDEPELGSLKQNQAVEITWDGVPNRVWTGQVEQLPKSIVARGPRNVGEVICSVDDTKSELLPNSNINVRIRTAERQNALTLSRSAVRTEGNKHYVLLVDHGRLRKQEITVGISNATDFEVLSGITGNDLIALPGSSELQDGLPVSL